jgi:hypothetical protein
MSRMDELAFVFRQKGYPEGGRIHWKRSVDSTQ